MADFMGIFEPSPQEAAVLAFTEPSAVVEEASSPEVAAWRLLLGSIALRVAGDRSAANDWLNHASELQIDSDVFKAELLGEAGAGLYQSDRLQDAFGILNSSIAIWRDACNAALDASKPAKRKEAADFAAQLQPLIEAAEPRSQGKRPAVGQVIREWLDDRAVVGRAQTTATFIRLLCKAGQVDDARAICNEEMDWTARNFTSPGVSVADRPLKEREMPGPARRAVYALLLALGEVDLAAEAFEASAADFNQAAAIYDGNVMDYADVQRLLQAKFNEANSLLRLGRTSEAIAIYELCEHGFSSVQNEAAAQRATAAKLYAQTQALDDSEP
jgi:pentatricopeptide repeat protein